MKDTTSISIFIADDEKMFVASLEEYISQNFLNVKSEKFYSGEDVLAKINTCPDLVFLDYNLNDLNHHSRNGMSILKSILYRSPKTSVYIVSGLKDIDMADVLIDNGAKGYIHKDNNTLNKIQEIISKEILLKSESENKRNEKRKNKLLFLLPLLILIVLLLLSKII
ncbi:MAG TPA: response regulator [Bacteroidia bacterium]|nr:response regulator [Bacteroidia bacterium]